MRRFIGINFCVNIIGEPAINLHGNSKLKACSLYERMLTTGDGKANDGVMLGRGSPYPKAINGLLECEDVPETYERHTSWELDYDIQFIATMTAQVLFVRCQR